MNRHVQAYRQTQAQSWTRVEMVLALYDRALLTIDAGIDVLNRGLTAELPPIRARLQRLVLGLIEGMELQNDDTSRQMAHLLVFALRRAGVPEAAAWADARRVILPLRDGFAGIREEAMRAERNGEIPPLDWRMPVAFSA